MRREQLFLEDILGAADELARMLAWLDYDTFVSDDVIRSATLWKLTVIGEGDGHVSRVTREKYSEIPWSRIVAMRNLVVHEYFGVDWEIIWEAATAYVPALRSQITAILAAEYPTDEE